MFAVGDIVHVMVPTIGKSKYHICVCPQNSDEILKFFFVNSENGYVGDLIYPDGTITGLPVSRTGQSVVSCSTLVRLSTTQLMTFGANKVGISPPAVLADIKQNVQQTGLLTKNQVLEIVANI